MKMKKIQINTLENLLKNSSKLLASYTGIVDEIYDNITIVRLTTGTKSIERRLPRGRLASVKLSDGKTGADFVGAQIQYNIYSLGVYRISEIKYIGKPLEKITKDIVTITEEELVGLDS